MTALNKHQLVFSIIIPSYNYAKTLGRAINSILNQGGDDYEILIIDDGSTDNTPAIAGEYCKKFNNKIKYYLQENQGPATARNYGAKLSLGEYLFFLDADDEMSPNSLKFLRKRLADSEHPDVFFGDHISTSPDGVASYSFTNPLPESNEKRFSAYIFKKLNLSHCAKFVHRKVFDKISYPVELRSSEDIPFMAKLLAIYECELVRFPMTVVHKHEDSLRHNTSYAKEVGEKVVDHIFACTALPIWAAKYEEAYRARRCLSIFRTLYMAGQRKESLFFYRRAISLSPLAALRLGYIRKALGAWLSD